MLPKRSHYAYTDCYSLYKPSIKQIYSNAMLFATYDSEYAYSSSHGRQEIKEDIRKSNKIKDVLKYGISESIDLVKEKNERMKKQITMAEKS